MFTINIMVCKQSDVHVDVLSRCGLSSNMEHLIKENSSVVKNIAEFDSKVKTHRSRALTGIITIPVVFNVVWNTSVQNISDTLINAQVKQLNDDFSKLNSDNIKVPEPWTNVASNFEIKFVLSGIRRKYTRAKSFRTNNDVKFNNKNGLSAVNTNSYFNIWVCNLSNGVLGYAEFPTNVRTNTYGVVLHYGTLGSLTTKGLLPKYNMGRTLTHEIGHCLNLRHIWGDDGTGCSGTDFVADTPNQAGPVYGAPTFPKYDSCNTSYPGVMFMNFMDYTDDISMYMFTEGQKTRCRASMELAPYDCLHNAPLPPYVY